MTRLLLGFAGRAIFYGAVWVAGAAIELGVEVLDALERRRR